MVNGSGNMGITFYLGLGWGLTGFTYDEAISCLFDFITTLRKCSFSLGIYGTVNSHCVNIHLETICLGHFPLSLLSLCKVYKKQTKTKKLKNKKKQKKQQKNLL